MEYIIAIAIINASYLIASGLARVRARRDPIQERYDEYVIDLIRKEALKELRARKQNKVILTSPLIKIKGSTSIDEVDGLLCPVTREEIPVGVKIYYLESAKGYVTKDVFDAYNK